MRKPSVAITGVTGFVGSNLRRHLEPHVDITGVSRLETAGTATYEQFLAQPFAGDAIVHLAGKAHDLNKVASEADYRRANVELTKIVYEHFLRSSATTFIYVSSVKAVTDQAPARLTEDDAAAPATIYGKTKKMAEDYLLARMPADKRVFVLRPCMIHGPGNKGNLNLLYGIVSRGFPYPLAAFGNRRSFLSVENLCFVIERLLRGNVPSGVYNVADDGALSTNEVVELMAASLGRPARLLRLPRPLVRALAGVGSVLHLPLNSERLHKLTENYVVDNSRLKGALGCDLPVSLSEGLMRTFSAFRERS